LHVKYCMWAPSACWGLKFIGFLSHTGPWMDTFGLGDAAKHIGTPQSIAIRNPDCSVATHLINLVKIMNIDQCAFSEQIKMNQVAVE